MPHIMKKYYPWRNIFFVAGEGVLIFLIVNAVFIPWAGYDHYSELFVVYGIRAAVVTIVFLLCFYYFDLYDLSIIPKFSEHILQVIQAFGFGCITLSVLYFFFPVLIISTEVFFFALLTAGMVIFSWRFFYFKLLERRMFTKPIAIIGTGKVAGEVVSAIDGKKDSGFKIAAFVGSKNPLISQDGIPVFSDIKELTPLCMQRKIEKIVLAVDEKRGVPMHDLIQYKFMGIEILNVERFYESLTGKIMVERVNPSLLLFADGFYVGLVKRGIKRIIDIGVSAAMLMMAFPVFLLTAVAIKLESEGDVFYRQERVGKNGRIFNVIKFRSMVSDAEKDGVTWAKKDDDRVTRCGRFIRKTRIDELPQLINVLRGEMSFVGPRPERPVFVEELARSIPYYNIRHVVKPGITGWAQVSYPYGASVEDALRKLEYDLYYIKNLSIGMDLATIFQTIKVVLLQKGAR